MAQPSNIEWTDATWNPVRGCSRVSEGCMHCYAERVAARFSGSSPGGIMKAAERPQKVGDVSPPFAGFAYPTKAGPRWTGRVELIPEKLDEPLRWKKPRRIFVNSMSDLFHERLSDEAIAAVFGAMAACPQQTFQVLTKRPERMLRWFGWAQSTADEGNLPLERCMAWALSHLADRHAESIHFPPTGTWPLPNVWLGVSVEDQAAADARIPLLIQTPAALRFVSYEPALGPVDFRAIPVPNLGLSFWNPLVPPPPDAGGAWAKLGKLDWLIVGGESGTSARPFNVAWARSAVAQCKAAGVPVFVKQLGAAPFLMHEHGDSRSVNEIGCPGAGRGIGGLCHHSLRLRDRKGGDPSEWPEDLRVREFPESRA